MAAEVGYRNWQWMRPLGGVARVWVSPAAEGRVTAEETPSASASEVGRDAATDDEAVEYLVELPGDVVSYRPLEEYTGLFVAFANIAYDPTRANPHRELEVFAEEHGRLGGDITERVHCGHGDVLGERVERWYREAEALGRVFDLWEWARTGATTDLAGLVTWFKDGVVFNDGRSGEVIEGALEEFEDGDLVGPAWRYLTQRLDVELARHTRTSIQPGEDGRPRVRLEPDSLLGALWLQLALAVVGDKRYGICEQCGEWFEVGPGAANKNRMYCSEACKARAYRLRVKAREG